MASQFFEDAKTLMETVPLAEHSWTPIPKLAII
jgi:hypothetical protein